MDKIDYFFIDKIHESAIIDQRLIYLFFSRSIDDNVVFRIMNLAQIIIILIDLDLLEELILVFYWFLVFFLELLLIEV